MRKYSYKAFPREAWMLMVVNFKKSGLGSTFHLPITGLPFLGRNLTVWTAISDAQNLLRLQSLNFTFRILDRLVARHPSKRNHGEATQLFEPAVGRIESVWSVKAAGFSLKICYRNTTEKKDSFNGTKAEAEGCANKLHPPTKPCHMLFAD